MQTLRIKKLHAQAQIPAYQSKGAACFDIHAIVEAKDGLGATGVDGASITVPPGGSVIISTGLAFDIPAGWKIAIHSRSGHGFKDNVRLSNCQGVIDADYRGEVKVSLHNDSRKKFVVRHGDRIAQGELVPVTQCQFDVVDSLSATDRGTDGFGSTGV